MASFPWLFKPDLQCPFSSLGNVPLCAVVHLEIKKLSIKPAHHPTLSCVSFQRKRKWLQVFDILSNCINREDPCSLPCYTPHLTVLKKLMALGPLMSFRPSRGYIFNTLTFITIKLWRLFPSCLLHLRMNLCLVPQHNKTQRLTCHMNL